MGNTINYFVFRPPKPPSYDPSKTSSPINFCKIQKGPTQNDFLYGYLIDIGAKLTILYSHGNAEDIGQIYRSLTKKSIVWNVNIFAYEYTGYGPNPQTDASETEILRDIDAAYCYLRDVKGMSPENIILFGRSLGSGPTCHLAAKHRFRGVILQSAFLSIFKAAFRSSAQFLANDMFENYRHIKKINSDILIIHGKRDGIIPFSHAEELCQLGGKKARNLWLEEAKHNDVELVEPQKYYSGVADFLRTISVSRCTYIEPYYSSNSTSEKLPLGESGGSSDDSTATSLYGRLLSRTTSTTATSIGEQRLSEVDSKTAALPSSSSSFEKRPHELRRVQTISFGVSERANTAQQPISLAQPQFFNISSVATNNVGNRVALPRMFPVVRYYNPTLHQKRNVPAQSSTRIAN